MPSAGRSCLQRRRTRQAPPEFWVRERGRSAARAHPPSRQSPGGAQRQPRHGYRGFRLRPAQAGLSVRRVARPRDALNPVWEGRGARNGPSPLSIPARPRCSRRAQAHREGLPRRHASRRSDSHRRPSNRRRGLPPRRRGPAPQPGHRGRIEQEERPPAVFRHTGHHDQPAGTGHASLRPAGDQERLPTVLPATPAIDARATHSPWPQRAMAIGVSGAAGPAACQAASTFAQSAC